MEQTGKPIDEALPLAKRAFKQYIGLCVDAMKEYVKAGYSEDAALMKARQTVDMAIAWSC